MKHAYETISNSRYNSNNTTPSAFGNMVRFASSTQMFFSFIANVHSSLLNHHHLRTQSNPLLPLRKHPPLVNHHCQFLRLVNNHSRIPRLVLLRLSMLVRSQDLVKVRLASHRLHPHSVSRHLAQFCLRNLKALSGNLRLGNQLLLNQRLDNRRLVNHRCWDKLHLPLQIQIPYQHRRSGRRLLLQQQISPSLRLVNQRLANRLLLKASRL